MQSIGIFGGTFDPVHYGHLRTAFELQQKLALDEIRFMPCGIPPHRSVPLTDSSLRLRMLQAAVGGEQRFVVDDRELQRPGPSYTVDTLASLRADFPDRSLCLLIGMDAFLELPSWHEWQRLIDFAHIVVAHRPGWQTPQDSALGEFLSAHKSTAGSDLSAERCGCVHIERVTQLEISSTDLRASIRSGIEPKYLMPRDVWTIIAAAGCYAA